MLIVVHISVQVQLTVRVVLSCTCVSVSLFKTNLSSKAVSAVSGKIIIILLTDFTRFGKVVFERSRIFLRTRHLILMRVLLLSLLLLNSVGRISV
jgi:hypothetical protein